jgi:hypothetical protein
MMTADDGQRAQLLDSLRPKPGQDGYAEQEDLYETAFKANTQIELTRKNDPAELVSSRIDRSLPLGDQALQSISLQKAMGIANPRPISEGDVDNMVNEYMQAPPGSKATLMATWKANYGTDGYDAVMRQAFSKMPPSAMFADQVSSETLKRLSSLDPVTMEALDANIGETQAAKIRKDMEPLWNTVATAMGGNAPQGSVMHQSFNKLAADFQRTGDPDAVNHAYKELFGAYDFKGTWMGPAGTDFEKLKQYGADKISKLDDIKGAHTPYELSLIKSSLTGANRWQYDSAGRYYLMDQSDQPVFDSKDQPISFTLPAAQMWTPPKPEAKPAFNPNVRDNPA